MLLLFLALILTCVTAARYHEHGPSGFEEKHVYISDWRDYYLQPLHRNNTAFIFNITGYCIMDPQYSMRLCQVTPYHEMRHVDYLTIELIKIWINLSDLENKK